MIIECPKCSKKFNLDESLIPDIGRLVKCGSCNNTWFFTKDNSKSETKKKDINENYVEKEINVNIDSEQSDNLENKLKTINFNKEKNPKKKHTTGEIPSSKDSTNYINNFFIFTISIIALFLLIDTFKNQLSIVFPGVINLSESLYFVLNDINLFIKDLFR